MEQGSFLSGGVSFLHTVVDGKHSYEVDKVLTSKPSDFGRKGDKLLKINNVETQHLIPKKVARMLSSGSPMLMMHQASIDGDEKKKYPGFDSMRPFHKEISTLNFTLAMVRETCLNEEEENPQVPEDSELKICTEYVKKNFDCQVLIQSLLQKNICPENIRSGKAMSNSTKANITIYYYLSNAQDDFDKGVPVVLNFSDSATFLKCICKNGRPVLTLECCENSKLQSIYKNDPSTWPFVFYLKTTKENHRRFESAAYCGWFIHTKPSGMVNMDTGTNYSESNFYVIIHLGNE
ncbi:uncharacterized protein LOC132838478 isoform X2 [Tachysurus vachellii]|uniref:uncharacterized protein LOC132838478 isoform X2 n=1 Tax=Tachysurus vachellii TaxID=175792 RepID=UPI00296AE841|nr:uncharacterized protein LOC132838478 isoform X2 [Tachysurus vachellii]